MHTLKPIFKDLPFSIAEENIQSRSRGNLLMAIANKFGYILLNTSNKSELATGYGTLYGDMAGGIGVLGDCYKLQVYALAEYINRDERNHTLSISFIRRPVLNYGPIKKMRTVCLNTIFLTRFCISTSNGGKDPKEIKDQGFDAAVVDRILKLVNANEYKRNQFCPIIRVSPKAFGVGRRVPIVGKYLS